MPGSKRFYSRDFLATMFLRQNPRPTEVIRAGAESKINEVGLGFDQTVLSNVLKKICV
jgi:hypothetical protein